MLAERFAVLTEQIDLTVRLLKAGKEIKTPGYRAQSARFTATGTKAVAAVRFAFSAPTAFDTVRWSEGDVVLRDSPVSYDGPAGSHRATLEIEVGA